jgi:ketosteroid isomerase-like protein
MKLLIYLMLTAFASALAAQENASIVLDNYSRAIGGQSNINQLKSIYAFADCKGPNGKYQTEIYSAKGTKTIFRQIRENKPDYTGIANADIYWTKDSQATNADKKTAFVWRSHEIQWIATHLPDRFSNINFAGYENFSEKQAVKFSARDELNQTAHLYFDKSKNLLLGFTLQNPFSENPDIIQMEIVEWKKVKKMQLPSKVSFTDKQGKFVLEFHTIKINQVNEAVFDVPQNIMAIKQIMDLHHLQRTAHFNRDARLLVSILADDYTEIRNGKLSNPKKEDLITRFQAYFESVTFIEWDDIQPPLISVSADGTLAYAHVNKRVRLKTKEGKEELSIFAWTGTYQKRKDTWKLTSITSTSEN